MEGKRIDMLKRVIAMTMALLLSLGALFSGSAAQGMQTFTNDKYYFSMQMPSSMKMMTPENMESYRAYIANQGWDYSEIKNRFKAQGILALAYDNPNQRELYIMVNERPKAAEITSLDKLTQDDMEELYQYYNTSFLKAMNVEPADFQLVTVNDTKYIRVLYADTQESEAAATCAYLTFQNGFEYHMVYYAVGQENYDLVQPEMDALMKTLQFTQKMSEEEVNKYVSTRKFQVALAQWGLAAGIVLAVLVVFVVVFVIMRKRSKKAKQAGSPAAAVAARKHKKK